MMSRTVIDIDRDALEAARSHLGTKTIKDTVNEALRRVASARTEQQLAALDAYPAEPIEEFLAWRRSRDDRVTP
jgi:Arc/MetJ family transcription regulator